MQTGTITNVNMKGAYGFIRVSGSRDSVFFHITSLVDLPFDEQLVQRDVQFEIQPSDKGPRAVNVCERHT